LPAHSGVINALGASFEDRPTFIYININGGSLHPIRKALGWGRHQGSGVYREEERFLQKQTNITTCCFLNVGALTAPHPEEHQQNNYNNNKLPFCLFPFSFCIIYYIKREEKVITKVVFITKNKT
jgi:hypothetical protein